MRRTNISLPEDVYQRLRHYAFDHNTSMSKVIQGALSTLFSEKISNSVPGKNIVREKIEEEVKVKNLGNTRSEIDPDNYF